MSVILKNKLYVILICIAGLLIYTFLAFWAGLYTGQIPHQNTGNVVERVDSSEENHRSGAVNKPIRSPVDGIELRGSSSRILTGLFIITSTVDIFLEYYGNDPSEARLVAYHENYEKLDKGYRGFVIMEEDKAVCLNELYPFFETDRLMIIIEYICGDHHELKLTSFSIEQNSNNKGTVVDLDKVDEYYLTDHFSSVYLQSFVEVIGWKDYDHLIVNQITYPNSQPGSIGEEYNELYVFNVNDKSKQLIYSAW